MSERVKTFTSKNWPFLVAFFVPVLLMGAIYAFQGVYPFGDSTLLTIDLGQQYIDFYSEYQHTFRDDPLRLIYSFTKSLGGEMIGIWAYYLMSPLNALFLFFPSYSLDVAVTVLTLVKIGLMGLSCAFYLHKTFGGKSWLLAVFSISYALMGYTIVYQLNLMWLDGTILLPLAALGVERLLKQGSGLLYSLALAMVLFTNYYIGYMICLFLVLYFLYRLPSAYWTSNVKWDRLDKLSYALKKFILFVWHSLLGAGLASFLLIPVYSSLLNSKADYTNGSLEWEMAYPLQEILSKFVIGAFNFDQMPSGYPNVFIGSVALILFVHFFFNRAFPLKERLLTGALTILFLLSVNIEALNKIWHAMQFPVWFPYRFSFVFSFFMILNGYRSARTFDSLPPKHLLVGVLGTLAAGLYVFQKDFDFLEPVQIFLSCLFTIGVLTLLMLTKRKWRWIAPVLFLFAATELTANAAITLSRLGHVKHSSFTYSQYLLDKIVDPIQLQDDGLYRIEKTFHRSKNDSHQADYNSVTHFSSTYESDMPVFFEKLGLPAGNGFSVYSNGTLFTDAFFGIKYYISDKETHAHPYHLLPSKKVREAWMTPTEMQLENKWTPKPVGRPLSYSLDVVQTKPDVQYYPVLHSVENLADVRYNPYSLPIGFSSDEAVLDVPLYKDQPIQLQNAMFRALRGEDNEDPLFVEEEFSSIEYTNVTVSGGEWSRKAVKNDPEQPGAITLHLETNPLDAYYLTFHPSIRDEDVTLTLNGEPFHQYKTYYDQLVLNLAGRNGQGHVTFHIELKEESIDLSGMQLYRLDHERFTDGIEELQAGGIKVLEHSSNSLTANATVSNNQELVVFTLPYDEGWSIKVNGDSVEPIEVFNSLLAVPLSPGMHRIEMTYQTPYLAAGISVSLMSLAALSVTVLLEKKYSKTLLS
ncbi:YfhO family protein [Atopococcus tabaci]|uniref:YfhO family protein n=1 Tax=Atopococcus tabaci TaxID=269774 RepID=UPI0004258C80|nr:YfhO family protein [Atopococcus tabaci]